MNENKNEKSESLKNNSGNNTKMDDIDVKDLPASLVVLASEPLEGFIPSDIQKFLIENNTEADLASALAKVSNKVGWLMHEVSEGEGTEYDAKKTSFDEWWDLNQEIYQVVISILKTENDSGMTNHTITETGLHYVVKPFMERNGYIDGAGWWVNDKKE